VNDGYSGLFYFMLVVGSIVGVLGFVMVAAGAGS